MFHDMLLPAFDPYDVTYRIIFNIKEFILKNKDFNHDKIYLYYYVLP